MKKFTTGFLAVFALASAFAAGTASACDNICVKAVTGDASVMRGGQLVPVKEGDHLSENDVLTTSEGGSVDLALRGQAGVRVMPASEVELQNTKAESMKFKMDYGSAVFNIEKLPEKSTFEVQSQTAIAAVRGTQFLAKAEGGEGSFAVRDGEVQVRIEGSSQTFTLTEGMALDIPQSPEPGVPGGEQAASGVQVREASGQEMTVLDQASTIPTCG